MFFIFRGICSGNEDIQRRLQGTIRNLCMGYFELYEKQSKSKTLKNAQKDEFFGLRDFYRLELSIFKISINARTEIHSTLTDWARRK